MEQLKKIIIIAMTLINKTDLYEAANAVGAINIKASDAEFSRVKVRGEIDP